MTPLWTAIDATIATGGTTACDWAATGVSIDTRTLQPGDLFVALKDARDGHDFVAAAFAKGAAAALVQRIPEGVAPDAPLLIVPDVIQALEDLGRAGRARTGAKVIGVTGSVGKTSTKEMLRAALSGQGRVHAAEASYNNHWGVPLTLARMPQDSDFAVIEIGMNHPGEIAQLVEMAKRGGYRSIISHRSGETADCCISDLAVATGAGQIKSGAPRGIERLRKYNRLLRIEESLQGRSHFAGTDLTRHKK